MKPYRSLFEALTKEYNLEESLIYFWDDLVNAVPTDKNEKDVIDDEVFGKVRVECTGSVDDWDEDERGDHRHGWSVISNKINYTIPFTLGSGKGNTVQPGQSSKIKTLIGKGFDSFNKDVFRDGTGEGDASDLEMDIKKVQETKAGYDIELDFTFTLHKGGSTRRERNKIAQYGGD